jgi:hypothetical protein
MRSAAGCSSSAWRRRSSRRCWARLLERGLLRAGGASTPPRARRDPLDEQAGTGRRDGPGGAGGAGRRRAGLAARSDRPVRGRALRGPHRFLAATGQPAQTRRARRSVRAGRLSAPRRVGRRERPGVATPAWPRPARNTPCGTIAPPQEARCLHVTRGTPTPTSPRARSSALSSAGCSPDANPRAGRAPGPPMGPKGLRLFTVRRRR